MIVDGSRLMQWAAWMFTESLGLACTGFEPNAEEHKKRMRANISEEQWASLRRQLRSGR